eukprot:5089811-Alexandrium_andersonii.AAC.1
MFISCYWRLLVLICISLAAPRRGSGSAPARRGGRQADVRTLAVAICRITSIQSRGPRASLRRAASSRKLRKVEHR